ncbi:MAG TPA: chromate efflux transporter [Steroidobacteraceae bacterium]|nr:chromate efflux transporter [Steroidobacteraceae bacterium]
MSSGSSDALRNTGIPEGDAQPVAFGAAVRFWAWLGCVSFGGPAGQIAIMHRELVEKRRWISEERFLHALNFCMLLPGPEAQQLATYIGWLKHGTRGGIAAGALFVLPGFVLIVAISVLYALYRSSPPIEGVLFGLKAAVLAVVVEAVLRIGKRALKDPLSWWVALLAFVGIFAFQVPFPAIVLGAALLGFFVHRRGGTDATPSTADGPARSSSPLRIAVVCGLLWLLPILALWATLGAAHVLTVESVFFSKMAVVTFGGAYAVLAYVAQEAVIHYQWISANDMLQGLALAETTPGPLILVLTFVGFLAAFGNAAPLDALTAGLLGAFVTTWVTFVPCFLWIFLGAPHIERLRHQKALSSALAMVTAAVVGVILNLAVWFSLHALFRDVATWRSGVLAVPVLDPASVDVMAALIAMAAAIALLRFKASMLLVLGVCAVAGLLIRVL